MLFKVLQKTALMGSAGGAGGAGGAVYLSNSIDIESSLISSRHKIEEKSLPTAITKLEDITIYENFYGCKFGFIDRWPTTYNFEKFLKTYTDPKWKKDVITGANNFKGHCKNQKIVTLAFNIGRKIFELKT